jgi:hypothetical protein
MQIDLHARLLSAIRTADGGMALTFDVKAPSLRYSVGRTYAIADQLFDTGVRARRSRPKATGHQTILLRSAGPTKRRSRAGRPTNKERIAKYIEEHGGSKDHAAKVLGIRL